MGLCAGDPQRRSRQSEEFLDFLLRPRRKIDGMNIPGANGFFGAKPGGTKCFSPRMYTNEHVHFFITGLTQGWRMPCGFTSTPLARPEDTIGLRPALTMIYGWDR